APRSPPGPYRNIAIQPPFGGFGLAATVSPVGSQTHYKSARQPPSSHHLRPVSLPHVSATSTTTSEPCKKANSQG
ncbi:hypothetical protein CEXT_300531, partial [Caerostris extrusa]